MSKNRKQETLIAYLFILPTCIGFLVFMAYPLIYSIFLSFWDWHMIKGISGSKFVGFDNFIKLFSYDQFRAALTNNLKVLVIGVPTILSISLLVASILNTAIFGRSAIRTAFYLPYVTTVTAGAIVFAALFQDEFGPVNAFLRMIGISNPPPWLASTTWSLTTVGIFWTWRLMGYCVVIFLAGLQGISSTYYEAASIDGASSWQKFMHITFPLVSPTTFFLAITQSIGALGLFAESRVMTDGGPGKSSYTLVFKIYEEAFVSFKMGYASATAIVFFMLVMTITIIQWIGQKKWVNYL